ncbi:MAG: putative LPS assembly protein LptD [Candidatus Zixiibacteriota bacterium]
MSPIRNALARIITAAAVAALMFAANVQAGTNAVDSLKLRHSEQFEFMMVDGHQVFYVVGNVDFETSSGHIYCDSAVWRKGEIVHLKGTVVVDDSAYYLSADSVDYDMVTGDAVARGERVELWSYNDSLYAVGHHADYSRTDSSFFMEERPILFLRYPDSANMIEVIADRIDYDAKVRYAEAQGDVKITSRDISTHSGCAIMHLSTNTLDLFDQPTATSKKSNISGQLISILYVDKELRTIDVLDSAHAEFEVPTDSTETYFDRSELSGRRIILSFVDGNFDNVLCYGQAYSWYYPSPRGGIKTEENTVSGDTVHLQFDRSELSAVKVNGGAVGIYVTTKKSVSDTSFVSQVDTVDYKSEFIDYRLRDSVITLTNAAEVTSGAASLKAHQVLFDTQERTIEALSAKLVSDSAAPKGEFASKLQPNDIPVRLQDGSDVILGDYLIYSIDSEKGRLVQTKSDYQEGVYYGERLYREQKDIFYIDDGRYTTCSNEEPHFHFHSNNMKLIEGEKLIAKPVVFYIERLPILALPFYVFPLKKGRHSGILPFQFGKFQRGDRYVQNVGYYWAASEYWDLQTSFDYYEVRRSLSFNSALRFKSRYRFDGSMSGSYTRETSFNSSQAVESNRNRWVLNGAYNHTVTPSFTVRASGHFQSDKTYYQDFSQNLDDRLNRNIRSQVSFNKKFGRKTSISGKLIHDVNLDTESRTDQLPVSVSLPTIWPFGSSSTDENGTTVTKWYQSTTFRYSPGITNFSSRVTQDSTITDTISGLTDTVSWRSRKKYSKITHNPAITLPRITLLKYFNFTPRFSYSETWYKIYQTDQSDDAGIDASTTYRTFSYNGGISATTKLYGTLSPNLFGLSGIRHVITPTANYSWSPEFDRHKDIQSFAGGGNRKGKSSILSASLSHLFQAKIKNGESEKTLDLFSVTSSFSYNFEDKDSPFSDLATSFRSDVLPKIHLDGSVNHTFYDPDQPGENVLNFWSPWLTSFRVNARMTLAGKSSIFDSPAVPYTPSGDSTDGSATDVAPVRGGRGWNLSLVYSYAESGRRESWNKTSTLRATLTFNLTPTTSIRYNQQYDIANSNTVNNSVDITRTIHCWTGNIHWIPTGSNAGFGFRLNVTALPEIKLDNNYDSFVSGLTDRYR